MLPYNNNSQIRTPNSLENADDTENEPPPTIVITTTTTTKTLPANNARLLHPKSDGPNNVIVEMDTTSASSEQEEAHNKTERHKKHLRYADQNTTSHKRRTTTTSASATTALSPPPRSSPKRVAPADELFTSDNSRQNNYNITPKRRSKLNKPSPINSSNSAEANNNTGANHQQQQNEAQSEKKFHHATTTRHERLVPVSGSSATVMTTKRTHSTHAAAGAAGHAQPSQPHLAQREQQQQQQQRQSLWERTKKVPVVDDEAESRNKTTAVASPNNNNKTYYEYEHIDIQKRKRPPMQLKSELEARKRNFEWRRRIKTPSSSSSRHNRTDDAKRPSTRHHSLDHLSIPLSSSSSSTSSNSSSSTSTSENDDDTRNTAKAAAKFLAERQRARSRSPARLRRRQRAASASQNNAATTRTTNPAASTITAFTSNTSNSATPRSASLMSVRDMPSAVSSSTSIFVQREKQSLDDIFTDLAAAAAADKHEQQNRLPPASVITLNSASQHQHLTAASAEHLRMVDDELERQLEELHKLQQQQLADNNPSGLAVPAIVVSKPASAATGEQVSRNQPQKFPLDSTQQSADAATPIHSSSPVVTRRTTSTSVVKRFIPIPPAKSGALLTFPPAPPSPKPSSPAENRSAVNTTPLAPSSFTSSPTPWQTNQNSTTFPHKQQQQLADDWKSRNAIPTPSSSSNAGSIIITTTHIKPPSPVQQPRPTSASRLMSMSITGPTPVFTLQPNLQWNTSEQQELNFRRKSLNTEATDQTEMNRQQESPAGGAQSPSSSPTGHNNVNFMKRFFERFTPNKLQSDSNTMTTKTTINQQKPEIKPRSRHPSPVNAHLNKILMLDGGGGRSSTSPPPPSPVQPDVYKNTSEQQLGFAQQASVDVPTLISPPPLPSLSPTTSSSGTLQSPVTHIIEPLRVKQIYNAQFSRIPIALSPSLSKRSSILFVPPPSSQQSYADVDQSPMLPELPPAIDYGQAAANQRPTSLKLSSRSSMSASSTPAVTSVDASFLRRPDSVDSLQQTCNDLDDLCQSIASDSHRFSSSTKMPALPPKSTPTAHYPHATPAPPTRNIAQIVRALNKQSTVPLNVPATNSARRSQSTHVTNRAQLSTVMAQPWSSSVKMRPVPTDLSCPPPLRNTPTSRLSTFQAPITAFSMAQPPSPPAPVAETSVHENQNIHLIPFADCSPASQITNFEPPLLQHQQQQLPHLHYAAKPTLQQHQQHHQQIAFTPNFVANPPFFTTNLDHDMPPQTNFVTSYQVVPTVAEPFDTSSNNIISDVVHKAWPINTDTFSSSPAAENVGNQRVQHSHHAGFNNGGQQEALTSRSNIPTPVITVNNDGVYPVPRRRVRRSNDGSDNNAASTTINSVDSQSGHNGRAFGPPSPHNNTPKTGSTMRVTFARVEPHVEFDDNFTRWLVHSQTKPTSSTVQRIINDSAGPPINSASTTTAANNNYDSYASAIPRSRRTGSHLPPPTPLYGPTTSRISNPPVDAPANHVSSRRTRPVELYTTTAQQYADSIPTPSYVPTSRRRSAMLEAEVSLLKPPTAANGRNASSSNFSPIRTTSLVTLHPSTPTSMNYYHAPTSSAHRQHAYPVYTTRTSTAAPVISSSSRTALPSSTPTRYSFAMKSSPSYPVEYRQSRIVVAPAAQSTAQLYRPAAATAYGSSGSTHRLAPPTFASDPVYQRLSDFKSPSSTKPSTLYPAQQAAGSTSLPYGVRSKYQPVLHKNSGQTAAGSWGSSYQTPSAHRPATSRYNVVNNYSSNSADNYGTYGVNATATAYSPTTFTASPEIRPLTAAYRRPPTSSYYGGGGRGHVDSNSVNAANCYFTPHTSWTTPTSRQFATLL